MRVWVFILLFCTTFVKAQDAQLSQFYSAPLLINPAFTGNTVQSRFTANYRNQWPEIPNSKAFTTYAFGYDHNFENFNSGVGLSFMKDNVGLAALSTTNIALSYAYRAKITRKVSFKPGIQFGVSNRSIDFSQLTFNDQLQRGGGTSSAEADYAKESRYYMDINAGGMVYTREMWAGVSFHHLNSPDIALLGQGSSKLAMRISMHGGYKIVLKKSIKKKVLSDLTFAANYKHQGPRDQLDFGAYFSYVPVVVGLWYRGIPFKKLDASIPNNEAIVVLLGYKKDGLALGYSYDLTVSKLSAATSGGAHELSASYEFASRKNQNKRRRRSRFMIPCPKF
ncbi:MAG: type IX secretion system membrane protein PorP/SprF [Flavobacteriales bacterium]|nr:type IX secretion system membrane protein PorP/SprF [Flavobacteriales bacterium]